jgi:hypothetical protein
MEQGIRNYRKQRQGGEGGETGCGPFSFHIHDWWSLKVITWFCLESRASIGSVTTLRQARPVKGRHTANILYITRFPLGARWISFQDVIPVLYLNRAKIINYIKKQLSTLIIIIIIIIIIISQRPPGQKHETFSPTLTLGSWVRFPLDTRMCIFLICVVLCR